MPKSNTELLPGTLDLLVLKTLSIGPQHGYGIVRRIRQVSHQALCVEEGSLYPALHRMERKGWIRGEWGHSEANRRARYYALTPSGRKRLTAEANRWELLSEAITRVLKAEA